MREDGEQRAARLVQLLDRDDRLRQLHQREDALLHASSTRGRDGDERRAGLGGAVASPRELLADDAPHGAAHEREVHDGEPARVTVDRRAAGHERIAEPRRHLRLDQALGVRAEVEELERVGRAQLRVLLDERAFVRELLDALARPHREVMTALPADAQALRELLVAVVRAAARAGVGMGLVRRAGGFPLALDGDVDAIGSRRHALDLMRRFSIG